MQNFDGLCVLPLNILNEKIYVFFWFYLILLAFMSGLFYIYRLLTLCSQGLRCYIIRMRAGNFANDDVVRDVVGKLNSGEWFFLSQLGSNLDPLVFKALINELHKEFFPDPAEKDQRDDFFHATSTV